MDRSSTSIKLALCILILCWGCSTDKSKFGHEFNASRKNIGLPELPPGWTVTKKGEDFNGQHFEMYVDPDRGERIRPMLFSKTVKYKGDELFSERNEYHNGEKYETIDGHSYVSLIFSYYFREQKEGDKLYRPGWHISYYPGDNEVRELTFEEADSLLQAWGLSR